MNRRVVITGIGMVSPVGIGAQRSFESLLAGKSGIGPITLFDASAHASRIAGEVSDYNPDDYYSPKDQRRFTRFIQFASIAAKEAFAQSGIDMSKEDPYRAGTIIGNGIGSLQIVEEQYSILQNRGPGRVTPFLVSGMIVNEAAGVVGIDLGLKGINMCTVTACASGGHAIGEAFRSIKHGYTDFMAAGGTEACITPLGVAGFCALKALSTRNDAPQQASRPFTASRDGFVIAEGAGVVILEELERAKARGADIIAEIVGYGATGDAYHLTAPDPTGEPGAKAVEFCLKEACLNPEDVSYINAHGTSTSLNDKTETSVIKMALGKSAYNVAVSSTKSMTGHLLGGAGAIELVISALCVNKNIVPPTINYDDPDQECDLDYVPNTAREMTVNAALSNSLGFGGHNVCLALKKYT